MFTFTLRGIPPLKLFYNTNDFKVFFFSFGEVLGKTKNANKIKIFINLKISESAKMQKIVI